MTTRLVDQTSIVWAIEPKNWTGAASSGKVVSLKNFNHLTAIINVGAWAGGTAAVTLNQATDVSNTGGKALSFTKMWTNQANTTLQYLTETAVVSNTFNLNTANQICVIEIDAASLDVTNNFDCVSVNVATPGSNNDLYGAVYVMSGSRFPEAQSSAVDPRLD